MTIEQMTIEIHPNDPKLASSVVLQYSDEPIPDALPGAACYIYNDWGDFASLELLVKELDFDNTKTEGKQSWMRQGVITGLDSLIIKTFEERGIKSETGRIYVSLGSIKGTPFEPEDIEATAKHWLDEKEPTIIEVDTTNSTNIKGE